MSKNTLYTPGPWKYSFEGSNPDWAIVTNNSGAIVANVNSETGPNIHTAPAMRQMPADANARLIAAAPDLLEACKTALALIDISTDYAGMSTSRELKAAIYKAEDRE